MQCFFNTVLMEDKIPLLFSLFFFQRYSVASIDFEIYGSELLKITAIWVLQECCRNPKNAQHMVTMHKDHKNFLYIF